MTIDTDNVGAIATTLKEKGVSAVARNRIMSDIKAAIANAGGDHARTPLADHMTAEESRQLSYEQNQAISTARRLGVVLTPGKTISASAFSAAARGRGRPEEIIAAKCMAAAAHLMHDD